MKDYKRVLSYLSEFWPILILSFVAMIVSALVDPAFARLMQPLVDGGFVEKDTEKAKMVAVGLIAVFLVGGVARYVQILSSTWVSAKFINKLRFEMFSKMLILPIAYFDQNSTGRISSRFVNEARQITQAGFDVIAVLIKDGVMILALLGLLLWTNAKLMVVCLIAFPIILFLTRFISTRIRSLSSENQDLLGQVTQSISENVECIKIVKLHNTECKMPDTFVEKNRFIFKNTIKSRSVASLSQVGIELLMGTAIALIIYYASVLSAEDQFTAGEFMSFMTAVVMLLAPLRRITNINVTLQEGMAAARSIFDYLDTSTEIDSGLRDLPDGKLKIEFRNLSFSHINKVRVFENLNLEIFAGQKVAFVGSSGCGKSTLANLLMRFYEFDSGDILINGISIRDLKLASLRSRIAFVSQESLLFNASVRDNLSFGLKSVNDDELVSALKKAQAWEFVSKMPLGLDNLVGEHGAKLSGGQRQRLSIARAILKESSIIILDEATSALDTISESLVQSSLEKLGSDKTMIIIAHRLSTIRNTDRIFVFDSGRITESGTHEELLKSNGKYKSLSLSQLGQGPSA